MLINIYLNASPYASERAKNTNAIIALSFDTIGFYQNQLYQMTGK